MSKKLHTQELINKKKEEIKIKQLNMIKEKQRLQQDSKEEMRCLNNDELDYLCSFLQPNPYIPELISKNVIDIEKKNIFAQFKGIKTYPSLLPKIKDELEYHYINTLIQPGDCIGIVTAQSIGEKQTQTTLNSVEWKEKICVKNKDNEINVVRIGEWIDSLCKKNPEKINLFGNTQELKMEQELFIPSVDEDGKITWQKIEAVTRHPPVDEKGDLCDLLYVKTASGRTVTATRSKSFLMKKGNKIVNVEGSKLKIGDRLPITINFPKADAEIKSINLRKFLSPKDYIFGSELEKAIECRNKYNNMSIEEKSKLTVPLNKNKKDAMWHAIYKDKEFFLPFTRSDSVIEAFNKDKYKSGFVYPHRGSLATSKFPEEFELDEDFGFFLGAYLVDGHILNTNTQISISNYDDDFRGRIETFCKKYGIGYHIVRMTQKDKDYTDYTDYTDYKVEYCSKKGVDIRVQSTLLAELIDKMCGRMSYGKMIPYVAINSNLNFVKALLDGYFSGDGCVSKKDCSIVSSSASEQLIDGIALLLTRFGIISERSRNIIKKNNTGCDNILPSYVLTIRFGNARRFAEIINLTVKRKQKRLDNILNKDVKFTYGKNDIIPEITLKNKNPANIHRDKIKSLIETEKNSENKQILDIALNSDVYFDPIIEMKDVPSPTQYVYDLTIENTRNFNLFSGLCIYDSFHKAGAGSEFGGQSVVSKFAELMNATSKPKAPSYLIYPKKDFKDVGLLRQTIGGELVSITIKKIAKDITVCLNKQPEEWFPIFKILYPEFELPCNYKDCLKITVNMEVMFEFGIQMIDIANILKEEYQDIICIFSPDCYETLFIYVETDNIELPEDRLLFINQENCKEIYLEEVVQPIIERIIISGIPGIMSSYYLKGTDVKGFVYRQDDETKTKSNREVWLIETENSRDKIKVNSKFKNTKTKPIDSAKRYKKVLSLPFVDDTRTLSNNVWDIYFTFGIEATREYMITQFKEIMDGISPTHVSVMVDKMTFGGSLTSVSRYAMKQDEFGVLQKSSFEETLNHFLNAGVNGQEDSIKGVSASIICGKKPRVGTCFSEVTVDLSKLPTVKEDREEDKEDDKEDKWNKDDYDKEFAEADDISDNDSGDLIGSNNEENRSDTENEEEDDEKE